MYTYSAERVNNRDLISVLVFILDLVADQGPDLVKVDGGTVVGVLRQVVVTHTNFTKVTRMVLIKVDAVVVLTTGKTATTWMFSVLACSRCSRLREYILFQKRA